MNIHKNARLTPHSRAALVQRIVVQGQSTSAVAAAFGVCVKTARKWVSALSNMGQQGSTTAHPVPIACIA